jgi:hypothetical protein
MIEDAVSFNNHIFMIFVRRKKDKDKDNDKGYYYLHPQLL